MSHEHTFSFLIASAVHRCIGSGPCTTSRTHPVGMRPPSQTGWANRGGKSSVGANLWRHRRASYCRAPCEASWRAASSMVSAGEACTHKTLVIFSAHIDGWLDMSILKSMHVYDQKKPWCLHIYFICCYHILYHSFYTLSAVSAVSIKCIQQINVTPLPLFLLKPRPLFCYLPILVVSLRCRCELSFVLFSPLNGPSHFIESSVALHWIRVTWKEAAELCTEKISYWSVRWQLPFWSYRLSWSSAWPCKGWLSLYCMNAIQHFANARLKF